MYAMGSERCKLLEFREVLELFTHCLSKFSAEMLFFSNHFLYQGPAKLFSRKVKLFLTTKEILVSTSFSVLSKCN